MAGGSHGYQAALATTRHTPERTSSSPGTAGLQLFISFSTSYRELGSAARSPTSSRFYVQVRKT